MRSLLFCSVLISLAALAGCGSGNLSTYPVHGKVVFPDGTSLAGGTVEFQAKEGPGAGTNARGEIQDDGTFTLSTFNNNDGALAGEHDVIVMPKLSLESRADQVPQPEPIDRKYRSYETSGLKVTVKPERNNPVELQVTPPGK